MRLVYIIVLAGLGLALGSLAHVFIGYAFAACGAYLGWKIGAAGAARTAMTNQPQPRLIRRHGDGSAIAAPPHAVLENLPDYKGASRDLDIVGESFHQDSIERLWTGSEATRDALLIPEEDNPHDRAAVRVEIEGAVVGHLSRETAREYRQQMGLQRCKILVHFVKGKPDGIIGVFAGNARASSGALPKVTTNLQLRDIDVEQLAQCESGDQLKLWLSPDQSFVNAYRRGSVGGSGRVATLLCKENLHLLDLMTQGRPAWLVVDCRSDSTYALDLRVPTCEEVLAGRREVQELRRKKLLTPYRPSKPIVVEMRAPDAVRFQEGQQLKFKAESIEHYATSPFADLEFIIAQGVPAAFLRAGADQRARILRAISVDSRYTLRSRRYHQSLPTQGTQTPSGRKLPPLCK